MSRTIDSRVVEMQFDNKQFERNVSTSMSTLDKLKRSLNLDGATKGLENVNDAAKNVNMSGLSGAVENVSLKFSALEVMAVTALVNITNSAINAGKRIVSALTIEPVSEGFAEYELKMGSIQTIMAGTGASLEQVNAKLEELNIYADKTIYSFGDMTSNIGKFTNAGVSLDESVAAIKGVANAAALSGSNTNEASRAMYNFAQALSAGYVKLIDWKSIENANMATVEFKTQLLESAVAAGTLSKTTDGMYKTLKGTVISATLGFNDSLQEQWMTTEALVKTLNDYADETTDIGKRATAAATEVKTLTQLFDTLKEAAGSGWAQTWELVIGDFEEAKETLTYLNDTIGGFIDRMSDARNELLSGALSSGWKQLMNHGISDSEDFKQTIVAVAKEHGIAVDKMVEDAGSFEKSLKNGWLTSDILSESIEKLTEKFDGLSEEEIAQMGYTIENVEALKKLNSEVKDGSVSMEEFEEKIKSLSGREMIFESLFNIAKGIGSVLKPIGEAFRDIFPPTTSEQLHSFIVGLHEFSEKLKISDETADKIKRTFAGLFAVLDLVKDAFGFVLNVAGQVFSLFGGPTAGGILELTARFGDFLVKLHETAEAGNIFGRAFEKVQEIFTIVADKIKDAISRIGKAFQGFKSIDMGPLDEFSEKSEKSLRPFTRLGEIFGAAFEAIVKVLEWAAPIVAKLGSIIGKGLGALADKVSYAVENMEFNEILDLINTGLFGAILYGIKKFIDSLTEITSGAGGFLEGITSILDGVRGSLEAYQSSLKAKTLLTIATAIGVLAAALMVLSLIDSAKLTISLAAITVLFVELSIAMIALNKSLVGIKMAKISVQLVAMATAILILSHAMKNLAALDWAGLAKGIIGIGALAATLVVSANMLDKSSGKLIKGSTGLIAFATAILIMAKAVEKLSELKWEELAIGLTGLTIILTEVVAATRLMGDPKRMISTGIGMIALGAAMLIFAEAVERMGQMKWDEISRGLVTMAGALASITIAMNLLPKGMVSKATGMVVMGAALLVISEAVKNFSTMNWDEIARGLTVMSGSLAAITIALNLMPKGMITKSTGMVILASSLLILSKALKEMSSMQWDEIARGLVLLGGSLLIITVAMNAMTGGLAGAAAMLVMAAAIRVFTPALVNLGRMDLAEIGKALLALVGAFVVVGAAGLLLAPVIPAILGLAAAIALLGVGVLAIGTGLLAFSAGLTALAVAGTAGAAALVVIVTSLISLIPMALEKIGEGIIAFAGVIINGLPMIMEAVRQIALALIQVLGEITLPVVEALLTFLVTLLEQLANAVPQMIDAGIELIVGILQGIADGIPMVVSSAINIVVEFLKAIGEQSPIIIDAGFKMIIDFINGLAEAIIKNAPILNEAMGNVASAMVEGLVDGISGGIKTVVDSIINLGQNALDGLKRFLGIKSPSTIFKEEIGKNMALGTAQGIDENSSKVAKSAKKMADDAYNNAKLWIKNYQNDTDYLISEEILMWESLGEKYEDTSKEKVEIDKNVKVLREKGAKEDFDNSKKWIDRKKKMEELSILQEVKAWERVQARYAEGTEQRKEADLELFKSKKRLFEEQERLISKMEEAENRYAESVDNRADSIFKTYGLFDELNEKEEIAGKTLTNNLKSQVEEMRNWADNLSKLSKKGVDEGLIQELQKMGPSANTEISALSKMTNRELTEYQNLWKEKHSLARSQSVLELQGLREDTNIEIAAIMEELNKLGPVSIPEADNKDTSSFADVAKNSVDTIISGYQTETPEVISEMTNINTKASNEFDDWIPKYNQIGENLIQAIIDGFNKKQSIVITTVKKNILQVIDEISSHKKTFYIIGQNSINGFVEGMRSKIEDAASAASEIARTAYEAAKKELGINSPSKEFAKIGMYVDQGFAYGLKKYASTVEESSANVGKTALNSIKETINKLSEVVDNNIDMQPTIRPVLDLSSVESGTTRLNTLFSRTRAMSISSGMNNVSDEEIQNGKFVPTDSRSFVFTQNNYSPKALSRLDIYRNTKNQFSAAKGVLET